MKGCHMPRYIRRNAGNELSGLPQFIVGVIESRDDERDDFQPESTLVYHSNSFGNVLENTAELTVARVPEALEIYLVQVYPRPNIVEDLGSRIAVGDIRADEPLAFGYLEYIDGPFTGYEWFVIAGYQQPRSIPPGYLDHFLGSYFDGWSDSPWIPQRLRSDPVLAIGAMEIAPQHSEG